MQLGRVVGHAVATVKHPSMTGWRLVIAQLVTLDGKPDGEPILVIDSLGASNGSLVLLSNDSKEARDLVRSNVSPVRWFVMGICDE